MNLANSKAFKKFSMHLLAASKVQVGRMKAQNDVDEQLERMKNGIIRMRFGYKDIDDLKQKIDNLVYWENRFAFLMKKDNADVENLKKTIEELEHELWMEKEENRRIMSENNARIQDLNSSLEQAKETLSILMVQTAKKHQRMKQLDEKIGRNINVESYFGK